MPQRIIVICLIVIPVLETILFIQFGDAIGFFGVIGALLATALIGSILVRRQGVAALARARALHRAGEAFDFSLIGDGLCLLVAGIALITPGFLTDGVGFLLLIPAFRRLVMEWVVGMLVLRFRSHGYRASAPHRDRESDTVIEVEVEDRSS